MNISIHHSKEICKRLEAKKHGNFLSKKTMNKSKDQQDDPGKRNQGDSEIAC